jgi:hypothetical protein
MKNAKKFGPEYDALKLEIKKLYTRVKRIRTSTYYYVTKKIVLEAISKGKTIIAIEDTNIRTVEVESHKYNGVKYNQMLTVM